MPIESMTLGAALTAGRNTITIIKGITATIREMGRADMLNDLIELQNSILEMQQKQGELLAENQTLKEENKRLLEVGELRKRLRFDGQMYELTNSGTADGSYCAGCFDSAGKLIRMLRADKYLLCPICKIEFYRD